MYDVKGKSMLDNFFEKEIIFVFHVNGVFSLKRRISGCPTKSDHILFNVKELVDRFL